MAGEFGGASTIGFTRVVTKFRSFSSRRLRSGAMGLMVVGAFGGASKIRFTRVVRWLVNLEGGRRNNAHSDANEIRR